MIVGVDPARVELDVFPDQDWILVRVDPPITETDGGIVAAAQSVPPARTGLVIRQGKGPLSDDGHTRVPMPCEPGDRILFERAAGKGLPRVPRETSDRSGWAYLLIKAGSVCATIAPWADPADRKALDAGAAGVPARPEGSEVAVSRLGQLTHERLHPVQDWMTVRLDEKPETTDGPPVLAPVRKLHRANGRVKQVFINERAPEETYDMWSGTCIRRGPGRLTVTRCLDGDRLGTSPPLIMPGERFLLTGAPPWVQKINELRPLWEAGQVVLLSEYPCALARLGA